ncbi:MMPL family transporter [Vallicoccus soli]|uniref:MMPL family transporter n=1 Tax=Vallicoccus soli TaxID=2339232 RepID=A0A3A3YS58_9ACTN|nr:MMPL family transporter [Vallicoccus soli]
MAVARWSARHRWTALLLWVAFVAAAVVAGSAVPGRQLEGADGAVGASAPADRALEDAAFGDLPTEQVLVTPRGGGAVDPASPDVAALAGRLRAVEGVARVDGPVPAQDGSAVLLTVGLGDGRGDAAEQVEAAEPVSAALAQALAGAAERAPDLRLQQVGDVTLGAAVDRVYEDDLRQAEVLSLPVSLAILVVAFGALLAAGVPLLLALSAVGAAMGLSTLASYLVPSTDVTASVILLVGMAVGVDYSLFYVRREREERDRGASDRDALETAAATSGRAVVVSGVTVVVAMAGMLLAGEATFASLAVGTILVVAVSVIGSVTVLPALLALLGRRVDRPRVPLLWRLQRRSANGGAGRLWPAVLRPVLARPALALALGVASLLALAAPALGMRLSSPGLDDLPRSIPELRVLDDVRAAFPAEGDAHTVAVWSRDGAALDRAAVDAAVAGLQERVAGDDRFAPGGLAAEYDEGGDVARVDVPLPYRADDPRADATLELLREDVVPATLGAVDGAEAAVTGSTAWNVDFRTLLDERMPYVVGFVLLLTVLVLVLSFRSLTVALTAAALNLLSVAAAYGVVVLVFQGEWAEGLLGFESNGAVVTWLPLFLFVILFGLSMDYHVFVVSRIREGVRAGLGTREAVAHGITRSAGVVTSAAAVMVAVFAIFASLTALDFKQLGVGLAAAILIDATVVRAVLLPSAMALLGERNWWLPRPLHRLPDLGHG